MSQSEELEWLQLVEKVERMEKRVAELECQEAARRAAHKEVDAAFDEYRKNMKENRKSY